MKKAIFKSLAFLFIFVLLFLYFNDPPTGEKCLHGHATAIIGNQKLGYWVTVSATALAFNRFCTLILNPFTLC